MTGEGLVFFKEKNVGTFCDREKYEVSARKILSYDFVYFCYFMILNWIRKDHAQFLNDHNGVKFFLRFVWEAL